MKGRAEEVSRGGAGRGGGGGGDVTRDGRKDAWGILRTRLCSWRRRSRDLSRYDTRSRNVKREYPALNENAATDRQDERCDPANSNQKSRTAASRCDESPCSNPMLVCVVCADGVVVRQKAKATRVKCSISMATT